MVAATGRAHGALGQPVGHVLDVAAVPAPLAPDEQPFDHLLADCALVGHVFAPVTPPAAVGPAQGLTAGCAVAVVRCRLLSQLVDFPQWA